MEKRRLGKTGHMSTILALGSYSIGFIPQEEVDEIMELALDHGVNHIDIAPTYGEAELRLRKWMGEHRDGFFLACKTRERTKEGAAQDMRRSMERMGVDHLDLYQLHGLDDPGELEIALGVGGALEAMVEAKEEGLVDHVGITSHAPLTAVEAVRRFDFDTVLFPLNYVLLRHATPEIDYRPLLDLAKKRDMGTIAMKAFTKQPWPTEEHRYQTWYEPWDTQPEVDRALWFTLNQGVTTAASVGDPRLFPLAVDAAERYRTLSRDEQQRLVSSAADLRPLFPRG
ncbi:hypothetical protein AC482_02300 [miscellaneous Crenarchaeota group-15 archaeon DG-45]|uniref:NADP-dependent oxidoreductase domain-containing protein n=1 Tax=miscellaneous Crenarchaeota group-15 archaeon DG-45 TaxID=1685127 RepID=A0A0M0BR06_9ARCH|nr:MAG: hypothetical protein AC482_02300 [miscellaneous Crenarchaeota group-15 archaeon DG-45]